MATQLPIIKNGAAGATFYVALVSQATPSIFQAAPTLAAGDVQISKDGGAFANLATLPVVTPAAGASVKVVLSQAETNADSIVVHFNDVAGAEWCSRFIQIWTAARHLDDLAFPTVSGRSMDVDANGGVEVGSYQAGAITAAAFATDAIDSNALAASGVTEIQAGLSTLTQAGVRTAVGLAAPNLDMQLGAIAGFIDTEVASILADTTTIKADTATIKADTTTIKAKTNALPAAPAAVGDIPTANQNADAFLDRVDGVEAGLAPRGFFRLAAAVLFGKASGMATTTAVFRSTTDLTNRVTATVDVDGNRSAVTLNP